MIKKLEAAGLVSLVGGVISLSKEGMTLANQVMRRHRLAERFLTDILGLSWSVAHHEAGRWEHVISPAVEAALVDALGNPTTCPHGNPIPGSSYVGPADLLNLDELPQGADFRIERIPEESEFSDRLLEFLEAWAIAPGNTGRFTAKSPGGATTIKIESGHVGVGGFASARILVTQG